MPIKVSTLEKSRKYRLFKVVIFSLPLIPIIGYWDRLPARFTPSSALIETLPFIEGIDFGILSKIVLCAVGYGIYLAVVRVIMRLVFYVIYGGIEYDTKKSKTPPATLIAAQPVSATPPVVKQADYVDFVLLMLMILLVVLVTPVLDNPTSISTSTGTVTSGGGSTPRKYCDAGYTYNFASSKCCPNSSPYYYPGGYAVPNPPGCYKTCPYANACGDKYIRY